MRLCLNDSGIGGKYRDLKLDLISQWKQAHDYIRGVADSIGYTFTDPKCTRTRWEKGLYK